MFIGFYVASCHRFCCVHISACPRGWETDATYLRMHIFLHLAVGSLALFLVPLRCLFELSWLLASEEKWVVVEHKLGLLSFGWVRTPTY